MLFFVAIFFLSLAVAGWLSALLAIPSIIMAYWLYCDEQELNRLSAEVTKSKLDTKRWVKNPALLKETIDGKISCKYITKEDACSAIIENGEVESARQEKCENDIKNACCYVCAFQNECEIGCNYLESSQHTSKV